MKNGSILLINGKNSKGFWGIVSKLIHFFTGSWITHVTLYLNGYTYESTVYKKDKKIKSGVVITKGVGWHNDGYLEPTFTLTKNQISVMVKKAEEMEEEKHPYNFFRFIVFPILLITRWFWRVIQWVPFNKEVHGEVCSTFIDELYKEAWVDLFDNDLEQYTTPADFLQLAYENEPKFKRVERITM